MSQGFSSPAPKRHIDRAPDISIENDSIYKVFASGKNVDLGYNPSIETYKKHAMGTKPNDSLHLLLFNDHNNILASYVMKGGEEKLLKSRPLNVEDTFSNRHGTLSDTTSDGDDALSGAPGYQEGKEKDSQWIFRYGYDDGEAGDYGELVDLDPEYACNNLEIVSEDVESDIEDYELSGDDVEIFNMEL